MNTGYSQLLPVKNNANNIFANMSEYICKIITVYKIAV